jgi:branched-chain amino acid transport system permease protein
MALPPFVVTTFERPFYLAMLVLLAAVMFCSWFLAKSRFGLMLFAIKGDEDRARGLGVRTTTVKVIAFALCCGFTGMAGGLWAYYITWIYPQFAMDPNTMFAIILMTYLGGKGTLWGPVLGAFLLAPAKEYFAYTLGGSAFYLIAYAALFLLVMFFLPRGIVPTVADFLGRHRRRAATLASGQRPAGEQVA